MTKSKFGFWWFLFESERRRVKAITEGNEDYYTSKDKILCLSVEESEKDFFRGLK